MHAYTLML